MSGLLIIGAGGNGRVIADIASNSGDWSRIAFLDDHAVDGGADSRWPVLGPCDSFVSRTADHDAVALGFGDNVLRHQWLQRVDGHGHRLATIIAKTATVSAHADIAPGTIVMPGAVINIGASVGRCGLINTGSSVDHDCLLGEAVHVAPGARLGGGVRVGDRSWIGIGSSIRNDLTIGCDVTVGAGAAVVDDLPDACTAIGVPARWD